MTSKKSKLLDLIQESYMVEQSCFASLTQGERLMVGRPDLWSPKDILAHVAEWKAIMAQRLAAYQHDQDNPNYPDTDAKNAEIFDDLQTRSWEEVAALLAESYRAVLVEVQLLTDGQLISPARFNWQRGDTLLVRIPFNAYVHPLFHIAQFCADRGDRAAGDRTIENMTKGMSTLEPALPWQARWTYTRACYYAIVGDRAKALADLREVSATRPDLIAWSREDTDMRSMWNDPQYRALLNA